MKRKKRPVAKAQHIPRKDEDVNIIASGMKDAVKFKKPLASIDKYVSKSDSIQ